jgi:uncharacterized protein (UPF0332 family)
MSPDLESVIQFRLQQAQESIEEAAVLLNTQHRLGAMRCIYYSMFYAANALLASRQLHSAKHTGVIALLNKEFVKTGLFPPEVARLLNKTFDLRQDSDYGDHQPPDLERLRQLLEDARSFLTATKLFLAKA